MEKLSNLFNWHIPNFNNAVVAHKLINVFTAWGNKADLTSEWKFSIDFQPQNANSGSAICKVEPYNVPDLFSGQHTSVEFTLNVMKTVPPYEYATVEKYKMNSLPEQAVELAKFYLPLDSPFMNPNGELVLNISVELQRQPLPLLAKKRLSLAEFQTTAKLRAAEVFSKYMNRVEPCHVVKIISMDGKEFTASKHVLTARSPVLEAMLKPSMKEGATGVVHFPDMASDALKVLLHFISEGELLPEWSNKEVVVGLTAAAHRYNLEDLTSYLDENVGQYCYLEAAGELLVLAHKASMQTAEKDILKFIRENVGNSYEDFEKFLSGLQIK